MRARLRTLMLQAVARASAPFVASSPSATGESFRRILLLRPDHIGDVLFATPAIRALRQSVPDAFIACLVGPWAVEIMEGNPHLDRVLTCHFPGFTRRPKKHLLQPYLELWSYARALRADRFDIALVLRFDHWWGAMLSHWAGVPQRIGYGVPSVVPFLTQALTYTSGRHEVEQNASLIEAVAGGRIKDLGPLEFQPPPEAARFARTLLAQSDPQQGYLCLHPGSGAAVKLWRPEAFAQVGDTLAERYGLQVIVTGSADEGPLVESIVELMKTGPITMVGRTSLAQLAAIMGRCRLVIGVDSGPMHLAVSQGAPTIHLFGPVDHRTFGPWGDPNRHLALVSEKDCVPCNRLDYAPHELALHDCVRSISVDRVLEAAETLLRDHSHATGGMI
jgi:lipopolysaccharide heptosyltransferase II